MKTISLDGKVALVTGAARGIGAAIARDFHARGARIVATDILEEEGTELAAELGENALFLHHDVREEPGWAAVIEQCNTRLGGLDILVNNAGIEVTSFIPFCELEDFRRLLEVNVLGVFLGLKHGMNAMRRGEGLGRGGAILNLSSMSTLIASPAFGPYGSTKAAVERLTKVAAVESGRLGYGVRVNCLYPGIIETDMQTKLTNDLVGMGAFPDAASVHAFVVERTPLGRTGSPADVAHAAAYLCSDFAQFITGAGLPVDGGMALG